MSMINVENSDSEAIHTETNHVSSLTLSPERWVWSRLIILGVLLAVVAAIVMCVAIVLRKTKTETNCQSDLPNINQSKQAKEMDSVIDS